MRLFFNLALRYFLKSAGINLLNILGLSLGIISALLILLYVDHEYHFDQFHEQADHIYRLEAMSNNDRWNANLGIEHARALSDGSYTSIAKTVTVGRAERAFFSHGQRRFPETAILATNPGSAFFDLFDFEVLEGNPAHFLEEPHAVVLTQSIAKKYFGDGPTVGEAIYYDTIPLQVTGVIRDIPSDTHFAFDFVFTNPDLYNQDHFHAQAYLQLKPEADVQTLTSTILGLDVARDQYHELSAVQLLPIQDIHLESSAGFGSERRGDPLQLQVFLLVGFMILLITVTNYLNLSLAVYLGKGRVVGIRKTFGESRLGIVRVFVLESLAITLLSLPIILLGFSVLLPSLNIFLDVRLDNKLLTTLQYPLGCLLFLVSVSVLTVLFPALTLGKKPIHLLLKSKSAMTISSGTEYRNMLIFVQFIFLFTLGISGWFMNRQIHFMDNKDIGFDPTGVIKLTNAYDIGSIENYQLLKTQLLNYPQIAGVAFGPMMGDGEYGLAYQPEGETQVLEDLLSFGVGIDYFDVMGIPITHGDFKNILRQSDNGQVVSLVNESFINQFGWHEAPLNKAITLRPGTENELRRKVSAVFGDFHYFTLKEKIRPQIISLRPDPQFVNTNILIRANTQNLNGLISLIEEEWYGIQPNLPMQYEYMEEAVRKLHAQERKTGQISLIFSLISIGLSIVGLVGFMIYMIGLKSKELTVRKVLGASFLQIVGVLNKQLWWIIFIAATIGSTLSLQLVNRWLEDYAYKISVNPVVCLAALLAAYVMVFAITALRSLQWTRTNPVVTLNDE